MHSQLSPDAHSHHHYASHREECTECGHLWRNQVQGCRCPGCDQNTEVEIAVLGSYGWTHKTFKNAGAAATWIDAHRDRIDEVRWAK